MDLERALDALDVERVRGFDATEWYQFLFEEYFRWKYTAPNRYATTTRQLHRYVEDNKLEELDAIRLRLLSMDCSDVPRALRVTREIRGLGTAGASGLLALLHPGTFGTVDQSAVKALRKVDDLPEAAAISQMNPDSLTIGDGVFLIGVMQRKAATNNRLFATRAWTPRKIDKILWTVLLHRRRVGQMHPVARRQSTTQANYALRRASFADGARLRTTS